MVIFCGFMLHMGIEPHRLGGYEIVLKPTPYVLVGCGYSVNLVRYIGWAERITTLASFHQIISDFHPEAGKSAVGGKCHQLSYLIRSVNDVASKTFDLATTIYFDGGGIATHSHLCCKRQYNRENLDKLCI